MFIIGITGGSGSGKSTVARLFAAHGGVAIDADVVYHELLASCGPMRREILKAFPEVRDAEGGIDRARLARIVFVDDSKLYALNAITHPHVIAKLEQLLEDCYCANQPMVAIDAIGLFESGANALCDVTLGVLAPRETRVRRVAARDQISETRAKERILAQPDDSFYERKCDYIVRNDDNISVEAEAERIYQVIMEGRTHE